MKRIVVDARMVKATGHGIGNYVRSLALGLAEKSRPYELLYLLSPELPAQDPVRALPHRDCHIPFLHPLEPFTLGAEVAKLKPSLYHSPSFASLWRYPCPHVQTVHDLNHLHFGSLAQRIYYAWLLLPSLRRARKIISVSESAATETRGWLHSQGLERPVAVAPNAIVPLPGAMNPAPLARWGLKPGQYFLAVANAKPFKNLALLERAYRRANEKEDLPPLLINTPGESGGGVFHTGTLTEEELASLLTSARAFFFPSRYEGLGRPPIEAALAGTPPVVSDIPPHREGLAGVPETIFLASHDESAWAAAFTQAPSARVAESSRKWIREHFSVGALTEAMHRIYVEALEAKS